MLMLSKILEIINKVRDNKELSKLEEIDSATQLREDCGFDSLDLAELTVRIEKEFNIDVFEKGNLNTIGEIIDRLK
jgi:acyl carrier protein